MISIRAVLVVSLTCLGLGACNSKVLDPPTPGPTVDLTGYFVRPGAGFVKFFSDATSQTYNKDTMVAAHAVVDVQFASGAHEYHRISDRAWVATLDATQTLFLLTPPLAAIPEMMPESTAHIGNSGFETQTGSIPVRRISRLIDTGLTLTVPAGMFDSVVQIRQEFWVFGTNGLGMPDTTIDSTYRWFAKGVDEIRRVLWRDGDTTSTTREMTGGVINGVSYP